MTQERLTALEDVAALATIGATYPELMLYLQAEMAKCEQALAAQPEQEPVISAWSLREVYFDEDGEPSMHRSPPAAPEQEPVAWLKEDWTGGHLNYESVYEGAFAAFPVYKHPLAAQRPWVGLTDEDMKDPKTHILNFIYGARWAEAKLKERNT